MTHTKSAVDTWMDNAGRYPLLCETDTLRLARKAQNPDISDRERRRALDRLCLHNLRLVVKTVQNTINKTSLRWHDEIVADLLQQGYLGLRRAAEKFDTTKKIRFSTYATIWINQSVGRFKASQSTMMKVPEKVMTSAHSRSPCSRYLTIGRTPHSGSSSGTHMLATTRWLRT